MSTVKKSAELELNKVEENPVYKPTPTMEKFVEIAVQLGTDNVAEICRQTELSEAAYYKWKKDPGFIKWMNEYANQLIKGDGWKLNNMGMKNAKRDFRYWESMMEVVGNLPKANNTQNILQFNSFFKVNEQSN